MRRLALALVALSFSCCVGCVPGGQVADEAVATADMLSTDMACGAAGSPCCVVPALSGADLAGTSCAPGLVCVTPDGGATHADHGTCQ